MSEMIIARRYAKALVDSISTTQLVETYDCLIEIGALFNEAGDFKHFILNPLLTLEEQHKVLKAIFENKIPSTLFQFILFLAFKGRLNLLREVIAAFEEIYFETNKQSKALVQSAFPLDAQMKNDLIEKLKQITGKDIIPTYAVHSSMIGGIRIFNSWKLYEYSFRNELQDYKRKALQRI